MFLVFLNKLLTMKINQFFFSFFIILILGCGNDKKVPKKLTYQRTQSPSVVVAKEVQQTPIDLKNKGIGPIKKIIFSEKTDLSLAENGKNIFNSKCTACHNVNRRLIGPPMKGIYERRSPEWVMNIILNPDEMLKKDPTAKALLKEYNNIMMLNQNITEDQARALSEYFRTL